LNLDVLNPSSNLKENNALITWANKHN